MEQTLSIYFLDRPPKVATAA